MNPGGSVWHKLDFVFIFFCAVFLYLHLFVLTAPILYEEDHLIFIADAWRMSRGESLYKDFFQFTFPGAQLLYLAFIQLFGTKIWIINVIIFLQGMAHAVIGLAISKHLFGDKWIAYLSSALFLSFGFRWFGIDGSHRMLSPVLIALAILILLRQRTLGRIFLAGLFCALASYITQQRGFIVVAAIALFLLFEAVKNKAGWKKLFAEQIVLGGAFAVSLGLLLLPFIISTGAEKFFDYTIFYIKNYVKEPSNYAAFGMYFSKTLEQGAMMAAVAMFYYCLIPLVYLVAFFFLWRKKYQPEVLLIALTGCALAITTFAPTPFRLFQISLPAIIILVWLISLIKIETEPFIRAAVIGLVIFGCVLGFRLQTAWEKNYLDAPTGKTVFLSPVAIERYKWLRENAAEGDYVFEVYQTAVNFPLLLPNPTQVTFLLDTGYTPQWMVDLAIQNLEQKKARFIVWDGNFSKEPQQRLEGDHLAPLYDYLRANYELRQNFTPYSGRAMQVWERK